LVAPSEAQPHSCFLPLAPIYCTDVTYTRKEFMPLPSTNKGRPLCHRQAHIAVCPLIHLTSLHQCRALLHCMGSPVLRRSNMRFHILHNLGLHILRNLRLHIHLCKVHSHLFRRRICPSTPHLLVTANVPMSYQWFNSRDVSYKFFMT
jgi:hypothetical protein